MAKILLVNPVVREEDVPRHIPYGLALLAAIAQREGHKVGVFDANAHRVSLSFLGDACKAAEWDVIAIGGLTTTYGYIKRAVRVIREAAPDSLIVAGGGFLTSMPKEIMHWLPQIDLGIVGEAFRTWPTVLAMVDAGETDFSGVHGVVHRFGDREAALNPARPLIHDLDELPFPAWDLFPLDIYFANSQALFSDEIYACKRRIDINGSYGCSLICRYCWHLGTTGDMVIEDGNEVFSYGRQIRYHSAAYIGEMVSDLRRRYNVDFVTFLDENLMTMDASSGRTWLNGICDEWERRNLAPVHGNSGVHWAGTSHAGLYRQDTLRRMREVGCSHLVLGIESFDRGILKTLGKGTTPESNIRAIREHAAVGIAPIANIIIGFPDESFDSVRATIKALLDLGIQARPHFATAYPGSEWYYAYKQDLIDQYGDLEAYILDLGDATKITGTISRRFTAIELIGLQEIVARRDLRLLDLAERVRVDRIMLTSSKSSPHFRAKKLNAPMEKEFA